MSLHRRILQFSPMNGSDLVSRPPVPSLDHPRRDLSNLFIAGGCLVSAAFFLALSYYAVLSHRRRHRGVAVGGGDDDSLSSADDGAHHAWAVQTVGLDEAAIASIAVREYKAAEGGGRAADCSVCLGDFSDGELLRLLPKCGHAFHVTCIDTWLRAHVSCPLCRAQIVGAAPPGGHRVDVVDDSERSVQETGTDGGLGEGEGGDDGESEMEGGCEAEAEATHVSTISSESPLRQLNGRSFSMDLLPGESSQDEEEGTKDGRKQGSSSKEVDKSQFSSSGRGFFFSKSRRSRSMALPL